MELSGDLKLGDLYRNPSQKARVISESWVAHYGFCLACKSDSLSRSPNNSRCTDFACPACAHSYELKTFERRPRTKLVDGAYQTLISRIEEGMPPTLLLLQRAHPWRIVSFSAIHCNFLTPSVVQARTPLRASARRAGWVGCNIRLDLLSKDAEIQIVGDGRLLSREMARQQFQRFRFLDRLPLSQRSWASLLLKVLRDMGREEFSLADVYAREVTFQVLFPKNRHVRAKLRQQLQVLRDANVVAFLGRGRYRIMP